MNSFDKQSPKEKIKRMIYSTLHIVGLDRSYAKRADITGATIIMYHSVAAKEDSVYLDPRNHLDPLTFEKQMRYLAAHRQVLSMDDLVSCIAEKRKIPCGSVVITFDDGYLDNFKIASPILNELKLPATLYLATGHVSRTEEMWIDRLYSAFFYRTANYLSIRDSGITEKIELSENNVVNVYKRVAGKLISLSYEKRKKILEKVDSDLKPSRALPRLTMNWEEVRRMINMNPNMALGTHTENHIDLSALDPEEARVEILKCTETVRKETGRTPTHFSCPYSRNLEGLDEILWELGYVSNVTSNDDYLINLTHNAFDLGRIAAVDNLMNTAYYTSGAYPGLLSKIFRKQIR